MFRPANNLQDKAFYILVFGALGDWLSTRLGLSLGLIEGNQIAQLLMHQGSWMQVDFALILVCFTVPYLVNKISDEPTPRSLFLFPLIAGLLKIGVSVWNLSLILV